MFYKMSDQLGRTIPDRPSSEPFTSSKTSNWKTSNWKTSNWKTSNRKTSNWKTSNRKTSNWKTLNQKMSNQKTSNVNSTFVTSSTQSSNATPIRCQCYKNRILVLRPFSSLAIAFRVKKPVMSYLPFYENTATTGLKRFFVV